MINQKIKALGRIRQVSTVTVDSANNTYLSSAFYNFASLLDCIYIDFMIFVILLTCFTYFVVVL